MVAEFGLRPVGLVNLFIPELDARAGNPPVAQLAGQVLLVEVEVIPVAGIAMLSTPYLHAGIGVANQGRDGGMVFIEVAYEIGEVRALIAVVGTWLA
jgi:hypothetical protein